MNTVEAGDRSSSRTSRAARCGDQVGGPWVRAGATARIDTRFGYNRRLSGRTARRLPGRRRSRPTRTDRRPDLCASPRSNSPGSSPSSIPRPSARPASSSASSARTAAASPTSSTPCAGCWASRRPRRCAASRCRTSSSTAPASASRSAAPRSSSHFDNSQGRIGGQWGQYAELSIKRVLTRDGDSSYYINNIPVRRRDIHDLFLGTGLGPRAYAIIEQGMISRVIEAKPEELRVFLEEAAGVSKYKERRKETEARIADTRKNLARVEDIRQELGSPAREARSAGEGRHRVPRSRGAPEADAAACCGTRSSRTRRARASACATEIATLTVALRGPAGRRARQRGEAGGAAQRPLRRRRRAARAAGRVLRGQRRGHAARAAARVRARERDAALAAARAADRAAGARSARRRRRWPATAPPPRRRSKTALTAREAAADEERGRAPALPALEEAVRGGGARGRRAAAADRASSSRRSASPRPSATTPARVLAQLAQRRERLEAELRGAARRR